MSVRARPPGQVAPGHGVPNHGVPAPAKYLPLRKVLATGIMNENQKSKLTTPEGAKCSGQIRFVEKEGLSNSTLSFEFYVRRAERPSFWSDPVSIFWEQTPEWYDDHYEVTPDSFEKVVTLFENQRELHPKKYFLYFDNYSADEDGGTLLFNEITGALNKRALKAFLAQNGKVIGLQNCIIYVTPKNSMDHALANWKEEKLTWPKELLEKRGNVPKRKLTDAPAR
jgi:hypothetical protein